MKENFNALQYDQGAEDRSRELNELWKALNSCDKDTYQSVISLLRESGSLRE